MTSNGFQSSVRVVGFKFILYSASIENFLNNLFLHEAKKDFSNFISALGKASAKFTKCLLIYRQFGWSNF